MGGGGTTTNTVQESELQKQQAAILKQLAPYITQYSTQQLQGLSAASPQLNQMLMQSMGQNTGASAMNYANTTNQLRQTAGKMGVNPGDPRMVSSMASAGEASTKANLPEVQAILSLFGTNPQAMIGQMGAGSPAGSSSKNSPDTGSQVAGTIGTLSTIAMLAYMMCDEELKIVEGPFERGLEELENIQPITFMYKDKLIGMDLDGFSAQNVQEHIPEAVKTVDGYLAIVVMPMLATLVNAVKELSVKIKELENGKRMEQSQ